MLGGTIPKELHLAGMAYRLVAAVLHQRGGMSAGHYVTVARAPDASEGWVWFDDARIEVLPSEQAWPSPLLLPARSRQFAT